MYETPSRSSSRLGKRRPPSLAPPSLSSLTAGMPGSNAYGGSEAMSSSSGATAAGYNHSMTSPGSPLTSIAPQTPQQRLMLRKPISMQTLSTVRSSSRLGTPRTGYGAGAGGFGSGTTEVYKGKIHVGVRAKPVPGSEGKTGPSVGGPWMLIPEDNVVDHDSAGNFQFDKVYEGKSSNAEVFNESVETLIRQVVNGFNATVFAYGTTGSGKTFTMQGSEEDPGVIQRSVHRLFNLLQEKGVTSLVRLSYFEIYNERVYDLLSADSKPTEVMLRDGSVGDTRVVGQREVNARNAEELLQWVAAGDQLRRTSSTQYNEHSSRSHAVVRIQVTDGTMQSILYLCDLAGSERAVVHTERRKEGSYINKSLLTLSTVISILSQGGGGHVPYRDSKLTRLLQPSLSGSALVSMLCTIQTGPLPAGGAETVNSIRFAAKAKNITVMAKKSSLFDDALTSSNLRLLEQLQFENESIRRSAAKLKAERDDLQEKLALLECSDEGNPEASLEAMSGISFAEDDEDASKPREKRDRHDGSQDAQAELSKELAWYKEENEKLHSRVSHLVSEITALDDNLANLESLSSGETSATSSSSASPDIALSKNQEATLRSEIAELKEQLKDRDLLIQCLTAIGDAKNKVAVKTPPSLGNGTIDTIQDLHI